MREVCPQAVISHVGARISDLCDHEKEKIAKLIQQLINVGKTNKEFEKKMNEQELLFNERLSKLVEKNAEIVQENLELQEKFSSSLKLLRSYQAKLDGWERKHNDLLRQTEHDEMVAKKLQDEVAHLHELIVEQKQSAKSASSEKEAERAAAATPTVRVDDASPAAVDLNVGSRPEPRVMKFPTPRSLARIQNFLNAHSGSSFGSGRGGSVVDVNHHELPVPPVDVSENRLTHYDAHLLKDIMRKRGRRRKKDTKPTRTKAKKKSGSAWRPRRQRDDLSSIGGLSSIEIDDAEGMRGEFEDFGGRGGADLRRSVDSAEWRQDASMSSVSHAYSGFDMSLVDIVDELESIGGGPGR